MFILLHNKSFLVGLCDPEKVMQSPTGSKTRLHNCILDILATEKNADIYDIDNKIPEI